MEPGRRARRPRNVTGSSGRRARCGSDDNVGNGVKRPRWWAAAAGVGVAVALVVAGCSSDTASDPGSVSASTTLPASTSGIRGSSGTGLARCSYPSFDNPGGAYGVRGPAASNLTGGADRRAWSVDDGGLEVSPPRGGTSPKVTRAQAECAALSSLNANGFSFGSMAEEGGLAIGYGRLTVAKRVGAPPPDGVTNGYQGERGVTLPAATQYGDRLAWIVVVNWEAPSSCPSESAKRGKTTTSSGDTTTTTTANRTGTTTAAMTGGRSNRGETLHPSTYDYQVWMVDAMTGRDALVYTEGLPAPCGGRSFEQPNRIVPQEEYSVPWTLVSRAGSSATIDADLLPCEGDEFASMLAHTHELRAVAEGPVAPACGVARPLKMVVNVAAVQLTHAPIGPVPALPDGFTNSSPSTAAPSATSATPPTSTTTVQGSSESTGR
jgi:hypothetical protein